MHNMNITCLIDTLNSGGAQRQMVNLVVMLKSKGYNVTLITYHPINHFTYILEKNNINHICIRANNNLSRIIKIRHKVHSLKTDVLISFLDIPSLIAQIISLPFAPWKTIVSERVLEIGKANKIRKLSRNLYRITKAITANSNENKKVIEQKAPWSKNKVHVIYNSVDLEKFQPPASRNIKQNKIIVVASFRATKNPAGLFKALKLVKEKRPDIQFELKWYGHKNPSLGETTSKVYEDAKQLLNELELNEIVKLLEPVTNIEDKYNESSVLVLPSFTEGLPNVVCEAMACGMPVLISNVADAKYLVENDYNGYLFDPYSIENMADTLIKYFDLSIDEKLKFGQNSRTKAEMLFSSEDYVQNYINIINNITHNDQK